MGIHEGCTWTPACNTGCPVVSLLNLLKPVLTNPQISDGFSGLEKNCASAQSITLTSPSPNKPKFPGWVSRIDMPSAASVQRRRTTFGMVDTNSPAVCCVGSSIISAVLSRSSRHQNFSSRSSVPDGT